MKGPWIDRRRRQFIVALAGGAMTPFACFSQTTPSASMPIKAVAFDAFPIFNPRAVFNAVGRRFPDQGEVLAKLWFAKIFPYTWLRTTAHQYARFEVVAAEAFEAAAAALGIAIEAADRNALVDAFSQMELWPDVVGRLDALRKRGIRLALLANLSDAMLRANMRRTGVEYLFEAALSTDRVRAFKPAREAYQLGCDAFGLTKEEIAFAAFAPWDAAGASWFGYRTAWVNRSGQQPETFGAPPTIVGPDLAVLDRLVSA